MQIVSMGSVRQPTVGRGRAYIGDIWYFHVDCVGAGIFVVKKSNEKITLRSAS